MSLLHNRHSQAELKEMLAAETESRLTVSFYRYFFIEDPILFRNELYEKLNELRVFGRIYIAHEGINAQLSFSESNHDRFTIVLESMHGLSGIRLNTAVQHEAAENARPAGGKSFWVLKIKVRDKIVADGIADPTFNMKNKGKYVNAEEYNKLAEDKETVIVDMRNHYEYEIGHFENAIEIPSDTFRHQLPLAVELLKESKEKKIIMYCTGGIRCEKASAYMLHNGFKNVYHLEGGIINYSNKVKEQNLPNKFHGKNFVFDDRLGERITEEVIAKCHQCGESADTHTNCMNDGCHLLFIQCEMCREKLSGCCSTACQATAALPPEQQKSLRKGIEKGNMIFNKSRQKLMRDIN